MFSPHRGRRRNIGLIFGLGFIGLLGITLMVSNQVNAQTAPSLGTAGSFAVLGSSTVTNTGDSVVGGDLGVSPGDAVTGFPPGEVTAPGAIHAADAVAQQALTDATTAYNTLASEPCTEDLTGQDLGGRSLTAGVYCFATSAQLTGALTLNGSGSADSVFIFKIGSTLTTASGSSIQTVNGANACNIFWQVGSSATIGTNTSFQGSIIAQTSVTLTTGANVIGRAFALTGAVTLDTNNIGPVLCASAATFTPTSTFTATNAPPSDTLVPTSAPALPTATAVSATQPVGGSSQGIVGFPNTGGGRPQPTYWTREPRR